MAIPSEYFRSKWGIVVMRYDQSLNEWFFVCWASKGGVIMDLGAGSHNFALWLICGDLAGPIYLEYNGYAAIYAMRLRK